MAFIYIYIIWLFLFHFIVVSQFRNLNFVDLISWTHLGIRKIHGPTDTRTLYTDLLNNIIFWKLEKYTDPIFWQFLRCHKPARTQTHSKNSKFFMISILLNHYLNWQIIIAKMDPQIWLDTLESLTFELQNHKKPFNENFKIDISWEVCKKIISCKSL